MPKGSPAERLRKDLEANLAAGISIAVANIDNDLKDGSPVDTGRFRLGWIRVEGKGADSNAMPAEGQDSYPAPPKTTPQQVNGKEDQRILNNLPYAQRLSLQGWSKKVSADWFTRIAQNVENGKYLTQAYRQLGFK
jgi:hypothetical protein